MFSEEVFPDIVGKFEAAKQLEKEANGTVEERV